MEPSLEQLAYEQWSQGLEDAWGQGCLPWHQLSKKSQECWRKIVQVVIDTNETRKLYLQQGSGG